MKRRLKNKFTKDDGPLTMGNTHLLVGYFQPFILVALLMTLFACSDNKHAEHADTYLCPMHPTVVSDRPSTCPVCGMDLVRKARPGEEVQVTEELARLIKSPNEVVIADIRTVKGDFKSMKASIPATGLVTYDTRGVHTIPSRLPGRLENVYLKYVYQPVQKGQKVADIYSPDLLTAQRELLYLMEHDAENNALIEAAKNKLLLLGATDTQIDDIVRAKQPTYTFSIYSRYSGYVTSSTAQVPTLSSATPSTNAAGMDGMGAPGTGETAIPVSSTSTGANTLELVRAGTYVNAGETLFKLINTSALRVELNLPASASGKINVKDPIPLDFGDGEVVQAKVDFVQPFFSEGEEFTKVRVYVSGRNLRVGQLVKASVQLKTSETLWLRQQAVLDLGLDRIVFVKERDSFKARKVSTGLRTDGWIEIKQGLLSADEVAENAQYLVDSESFIKSK